MIRKLNLPVSVGIGFLMIGTIFRFLHLPYFSEILTGGLILILLFYTLRFFLKETKKQVDVLKFVLISVWSISYLFIELTYPVSAIFNWLFYTVLIIWGGLELRGYFTRTSSKSHRLAHRNHRVFRIAAGIMCLGVLFKVMHWRYTDSLLTLGITLGCTWAILEIYREK